MSVINVYSCALGSRMWKHLEHSLPAQQSLSTDADDLEALAFLIKAKFCLL